MAAGAEVPQPMRALIRGEMEESNTDAAFSDICRGNSSGKPPRPVSLIRHCVSTLRLADRAESHLETASNSPMSGPPAEIVKTYIPVFRSGSCADRGWKDYMEDEHIRVDDLQEHVASGFKCPPGAFYGVFDGHGGGDAALFIRQNLLKFIMEDPSFPNAVGKAIRNAFMKADLAFADSRSLDSTSGTTAITALLFGRTMIVANAGDCRAVLGKRGKAVELSRDHKPNCSIERLRIESLGGSVFDGYLNGQLSVARALGDWHMKGPKGSSCPLSAEPELKEVILTDEDEFLILGCDGLWDVMTSQCAVTIVRKELMMHNDPERCSRELVREALNRETRDNLTVVVVCFSADPPPRLEYSRSRVRRSISAEGLNCLKGYLNCS
eukprot:TRINITY_DN3133_c0_g2_i1.p1 TRINITY_DN3133_c0_g2~~TRINITY_DN3133_c0_g2_i1.p1  ORF type:complete len:382 (-),score=55.08 TRINITY_DN3133_c0_g2_i1:691-1836(-)